MQTVYRSFPDCRNVPESIHIPSYKSIHPLPCVRESGSLQDTVQGTRSCCRPGERDGRAGRIARVLHQDCPAPGYEGVRGQHYRIKKMGKT
jgi:hypothetical protein